MRDSVRGVAAKTFISKTRVDRLMRGLEPPEVEDMRLVAKAYKKDPSFFLEFRAEYVLAALARKLATDPDLAAVVYRRLVRAT